MGAEGSIGAPNCGSGAQAFGSENVAAETAVFSCNKSSFSLSHSFSFATNRWRVTVKKVKMPFVFKPTVLSSLASMRLEIIAEASKSSIFFLRAASASITF